MRPGTLQRLVLGCLALLGSGVGVDAADKALTDDEVVVRTEGAHHVLLPKDWPVEEREGRLAPIPIEGYLSMKFGQVAAMFDQIDQRLDALERRLQKLEEDHKTSQMRLRLLETAQRAAEPEGR
jgi:hypothetical protein